MNTANTETYINQTLSEIQYDIEQDAYAYYEEYTGTTLARNPDGSYASQGHDDALDAFLHAYISGRVT